MGKFMGGEPTMASKVLGKFGVSPGAPTGGVDRGPKVRTTGTAAPSKSSKMVGNKGGGKQSMGGGSIMSAARSAGGPMGTKMVGVK